MIKDVLRRKMISNLIIQIQYSNAGNIHLIYFTFPPLVVYLGHPKEYLVRQAKQPCGPVSREKGSECLNKG